MRPTTFLVATVLLLTACATVWWRAPARLRGDQVLAPHDRHMKAKVECLTCHEKVYDQKELGTPVSPDEQTCLQCHKERKNDCAMCHTAVRQRSQQKSVEPTLRMSHAEHIERTKEDCSVCHKQLPNPVRTQATVPTMDACLACHEHKADYDDGKCGKCHLDLTRFALKPIAAFSHGGNFVREHMRPARSAPDTCAQCHDQTFCGDCHAKTVGPRIEIKEPERVDRDFIHRNDFASRHTLEAKADPVSCARCHGTSFCQACHEKQGLSSMSLDPRNPHPPGYSLPGSSRFHGTDARRDIQSCAACHDQGARSICVDCHRSGGIGGNPHPPTWADRHPRSEITTNAMCAACH